MNRYFIGMLALGALATTQIAQAKSIGVSCNGCNSYQASRAASEATRDGKVYVFDNENKRVSAYSVYSETLDIRPPVTWTQADKVKTDAQLQRAFEAYTQAAEDAIDFGTVYLPGDFPIRSVAGALVDPDYASTAIEDYLAEANQLSGLLQTMNSMVTRLLMLDIGILDAKDLVSEVVFKVRFPDGSELTYSLTLSLNPGSSELRPSLESRGNARGPDGRALPTTMTGMRGRTFTDNGGSIVEWRAYVRRIGGSVSGSGDTMTCYVRGSVVYCIVKRKIR